MLKLTDLKDAQAAVDVLLKGDSVIVSFENADELKIKQIIDFIKGTVHNCEITMEQIGRKDFIFVPADVTVETAVGN